MRKKSSFDKLLIDIINRKNNARQAKLIPTPIPSSSIVSSKPALAAKPAIKSARVSKGRSITTTVVNQNGEVISETTSEEQEKLLQKKNYLDFLMKLH